MREVLTEAKTIIIFPNINVSNCQFVHLKLIQLSYFISVKLGGKTYSHKQERCHLHVLFLSFLFLTSLEGITQLITAKVPAFHEITGFNVSTKLASYALSTQDISAASAPAGAGNQRRASLSDPEPFTVRAWEWPVIQTDGQFSIGPVRKVPGGPRGAAVLAAPPEPRPIKLGFVAGSLP